MLQPHFLQEDKKKSDNIPKAQNGAEPGGWQASMQAIQANNSILNRNDRNLINTREYVAERERERERVRSSDAPDQAISLVWLLRDMGMQQHGIGGEGVELGVRGTSFTYLEASSYRVDACRCYRKTENNRFNLSNKLIGRQREREREGQL